MFVCGSALRDAGTLHAGTVGTAGSPRFWREIRFPLKTVLMDTDSLSSVLRSGALGAPPRGCARHTRRLQRWALYRAYAQNVRSRPYSLVPFGPTHYSDFSTKAIGTSTIRQ